MDAAKVSGSIVNILRGLGDKAQALASLSRSSKKRNSHPDAMKLDGLAKIRV